jgi:outer membrane immunogenic protein
MSKKILVSAALAATVSAGALFAGQANAADTWTGPYVGATLGVGQYSSNVTDGDEYISYANLTGKGTAINGGVTAGYNWQFKSFVLGVEGDFNYLNSTSGKVEGYDPTEYVKIDSNWFTSIRARAGVTYDNVLIYVTGGPAWVNAKHTLNYDNEPQYSFSTTSTTLGAALGLGVEANIAARWTVKAEYLYVDVQSVHLITPDNSGPFTFNDSVNIARVGFNYKF